MAQIVPRAPGIAESFGGGLGAGLSTGLEQLANMKLKQFAQQERAKNLEKFFPGLGEALAGLDKDTFGELLKSYDLGSFAQQLGQQQQPEAPAGLAALGVPGEAKVAAPEKQVPMEAREQKGKQALLQKKLSPAELKHADALNAQRQNLQDIIDTTDRMRDTLKSGDISLGFLPGIAANIAPTWLGPKSELFDKDSAHIVNLTSQDLKGVPSVFRVKLLEKEKPGVKHSKQVNEQILNRLNQDAKAKLATLDKRYPSIAGQVVSAPAEAEALNQMQATEFDTLPPPSQYIGRKIEAPNGEILQSDGISWKKVR